MDKTRSLIVGPPSQHRRGTVSAPMAQQRGESGAGSIPQMLIQLIGCHDPAKRLLPGKASASRSNVEGMLTE
ncbi:conserved hypothetical protein [Bradyrhizobium sp. STM 3809]|nr:conserved hypothetical protein [Bradyrhizobium sp. STM 3809]